MENLRYPIGTLQFAADAAEEQRRQWIRDIAETPARLREAVEGLGEGQLNTPYRPGGWTVRQVVHHLADSHMNSYVRLRLALTEDEPLVKPYREDLWAELSDARTAEIGVSLTLLEALHRRWTMLLAALAPADWERTLRHPEVGSMTIEKQVALYAWHGRHHVAQITALRNRSGW